MTAPLPLTSPTASDSAPDTVLLGGDGLRWDEYEAVVYAGAPVALSPSSPIDAYRAELERQLDSGAVVYSVNTGTGADAGRRIDADAIERVQFDMVRSHAVGVGPPAPESVVRGAMLLQARAYAQGPPAMRRAVAEALAEALNQRLHPRVPLIGTLSASDLVPNAHIALALIGEGAAGQGGGGTSVSAPLSLEAKDGGITNNNAFATALAAHAVRDAQRLIERAEAVAAMTLQALRGFPDAYADALIALRPHPGAYASAAHMRAQLDGSGLLRGPGRPHDPFSLRCLPQVHGAIRDAVAYARRAVEIELSAVTDNPVVLLAEQRTVSGGNFHGEPIALPLDLLAIAVSELATLSQQRVRQLLDPAFDVGLPAKLGGGQQASYGLQMLGTVAAALAVECAAHTRPACVGAVTIDAMEDHVSMAAVAARKASAALALARHVVAVELTCAAQALELQGAAEASEPTRELYATVRKRLPFAPHDQPIDSEILVDLL